MAKIIACTQIDEKPVYINLDNLLFIGEGDGRADFVFPTSRCQSKRP